MAFLGLVGPQEKENIMEVASREFPAAPRYFFFVADGFSWGYRYAQISSVYPCILLFCMLVWLTLSDSQ